MDISLFDYDLPPELIAQFPSHRRDRSRLLVLHRSTGRIEHRRFAEIVEYVYPGDALVVNNTRVFKARLTGRRATGAQVEIFLVRALDEESHSWLALARPTRRLKAGESIRFGDDAIELMCHRGEGVWEVAFPNKTVQQRIIRKHGHVPLPQYIHRPDVPSDLRRYQTVYAAKEKTGAVAAPTAGFHFTRSLLVHLQSEGIRIVEVTLHVGPGTFKPVSVKRIEDHIVDPEFAELSPSAADTINEVRRQGGRIVAVGTTSVRTLEAAPVRDGRIQPFSGMVELYIRPGHRFRRVDHLLTNFHLPKSSLLILVSAFAGREKILEAYREAVARRYRFYSYGDAMLIL